MDVRNSQTTTTSPYTPTSANKGLGEKLSTRKRLWNYWATFVLQQYKADEQIDIRTVKALFSVYFLIIGIGLTDWQGFDQKIVGLSVVSAEQTTAIRAILFSLSALVGVTHLAACSTNQRAHAVPNIWTRISANLKQVHWYALNPLSLLLFRLDLFANTPKHCLECEPATKGEQVFSWLLLLLNVLLCVVKVAIKSELPTKGKLNSPNKLVQAGHYTVLMLLLTMGHNLRDTAGAQAFQIASKIVGFGMIVAAWRLQVFWWYEVNRWYILGHLGIFSLRNCIALVLSVNKDYGIIQTSFMVLIFLTFILKVGNNICIYRLRLSLRWAGKNIKSFENFIAFFTVEVCREALEISSASIDLSPSVLFELSQIGRTCLHETVGRPNMVLSSRLTARLTQQETLGLMSSRRDKQVVDVIPQQGESLDRPSDSGTQDYDPLEEYFKAVSREKCTKPEEIWVLLILQLIFLRQNLLAISGTLARYRKSLGSWAETSLNLFLIETMLRSRLETISTEDLMDNDYERGKDKNGPPSTFNEKQEGRSQKRQNLSAIFAGISMGLSTQTQDVENQLLTPQGKLSLRDIELGKILDCKHEYLTIISGINWFLDVKSDIFSMLFETYAHKSWFLYKRNALARKLTTKIDKAILKLMSWPRVPNYVYSAGMAFFLKVRFDLQKSEKIFKIYKANIFKYQTIANKQVKEITTENFMYNSVIMKVKMTQDANLGMISDITPNYMEHLGEPANEDPLRVNLNSLFPGKTSADHTTMMKHMSDQHIFNRQKEFQLNGFDGFLRSVRFTLKLDSDVSQGLHSVALLKFFTNKHRHLLLVDRDLNIVSAEPGFWKIMEGLRAVDSGKTVWSLSQSLAVSILFAEYLRMPIGEDHLVAQSNVNLPGLVSTPQLGPRDGNSSSAQNNVALRQLQQAGQQRFGTQAYTLMKDQVMEFFKAYEQAGIVHPINEEIGVPGLPIFTKTEFTQFGADQYYRVWVSFDLNYNNDTRNLMTTQLANEETRSKVPGPVIGNGLEEGGVKLSESETKGQNHAIQESLGSGGFQMLASLQNEFRGSRHTFEQILKQLKKDTPIFALVSEALGKDYPEEIKNALSSLKFYLQSVVTSEVNNKVEGTKEDLQLSAVIRQLTPQKLPTLTPKSQVQSQEFPAQTDVNLGQEPPNLPRHAAVQSIPFPPRLFIPGLHPAKGSDNEDPSHSKSPLETLIPSSQQTSAITNNLDGIVSANGDRDSLTASQLKGSFTDNSPKMGKHEDKKRPIPVIKVKSNKVAPGSTNKKGPKTSVTTKSDLKFATTTSFNKAVKHAKTEKPSSGNGRLSQARRVQLLHHRVGPSNQIQTVNPAARHDTVEEVDERLEMSGTDHKTNKTSLVSQLAKKLFRFRTLRQVTHDNSKAHSEKKRNELNPLAISAMAKAEAFISQNEANLKLIGRYINDFKAVRRAELSPDEKNNSVTASNTSSSSRGSYFFKTVTSTLETSKKGSFLYLYSGGLMMFSVYFLAIFQYLLASLSVYNTSTLNSFNMVNNFVTIDRKLVQSCEVQDYLYGLSAGLFKKEDYMYGIASFARLVPNTTNGSMFLMGQLRDIRLDIYSSVQNVLKGSITSVDLKDHKNVHEATFQDRYLTHWGNLTTPGIYEEWTLPYFTVLMYYCNILNSNLIALRDLNYLAWNTDYNFVMDPNLQARYDRMVFSRTAMDKRIYDKVLKEKDDQFDSIISNVIVNASDRHFAPVYVVIYLSVGVSVVLLGYMIYTWFQINANNSDYLENYNLLRPWELYFILEDNEKVANLFTVYCLNEIQMVNQYMDFMYLTKITALGLKVSRLEQKFSREKDKMMSSYKFSHDFNFFTSKFGFVIVLLAWAILGLTVITFSTFIGIDDNRLGMEKLYFDSHRNMLRTTKYFLTAPLLTTYGYAIPVSGESISTNPFTDTIDNFVAYHAIAKQNYTKFFGDKAGLVERVNFGDICGLLLSDPDLNKAYGASYNNCINLNRNSAVRGMLGFLQYEKSFIEMLRVKIRTNYSDWLEKSRTTVPSSPLFRELFEPAFLELRVGHRLMFNIYYQVMGQTVVNLVTTIKTQLDYFDEVVMQSICFLVYFALVLSFVWLVQQQREELAICYETFRIIDPYFVLNNRYLQFKFRAAFKGVE